MGAGAEKASTVPSWSRHIAAWGRNSRNPQYISPIAIPPSLSCINPQTELFGGSVGLLVSSRLPLWAARRLDPHTSESHMGFPPRLTCRVSVIQSRSPRSLQRPCVCVGAYQKKICQSREVSGKRIKSLTAGFNERGAMTALVNPWWVIVPLSGCMNMKVQLLRTTHWPQLSPRRPKLRLLIKVDTRPGPSLKPVERLLS